MANPTKFVSVNLNKSYGQQQQQQPPRSSSSSAYRYGNGGIGSRSGRSGGGSSLGGGGMVVLSRSRTSVSAAGPKGGARLAVPPPLNLPSLRKEHERFDPSSASGSLSGAASSGLGSGHGLSAMGWSKPMPLQDMDGSKDQLGRPGSDGQRVGSPIYTPAGQGRPYSAASPAHPLGVAEKAVLLRGEDFPSLKATFTSAQKQKDASAPKQNQASQQPPSEHAEKPQLESPLAMRPQKQAARSSDVKEPHGEESPSQHSGVTNQLQKLDGFLSGPLPMVLLRNTSDWADDERDTGHGIPERGRNRGFSRTETGRTYDYSDGRAPHDSEVGSIPEKEFARVDSFGRDLHSPSRNMSSWRSPLSSRDGFGAREFGLDRDGPAFRASNHNRDNSKENSKYGHSLYADSVHEGSRNGSLDLQQGRRGLGLQISRNGAAAYDSRSSEQNEHGRYFDNSNSRYNAFQKNAVSKTHYVKGFPLKDPILNFGRDRHPLSSSVKPYLEDATFDSNDPFSGGLISDVNLKVFKRKKDVPKQVDFHDPVRESFEAELERVQRLQEEERQRALQEHARALEIARKEEEERERIAREEGERRRRLEDEAREAAWRVEQEKLEAAKRAEEQRIAREEEKKRILMEEERRKEAARQKLLELEERIARRQAEGAEKDNKSPVAVSDDHVAEVEKDRDAAKVAEIGDWEDCERMVERITNSASSESSNMNRYNETGSSLPPSREGNLSILGRGKQGNSWKNERFDSENAAIAFTEQENGYHNGKRDLLGTGRVFPRRGFYGGQGVVSLRPSSKGGAPELSHMVGDFQHSRGHRWNTASDGDRFNRNSDVDSDLLENDKYGENGWDQNHSRDNSHALYSDSLFHNSEVDGFSSFGRSRHSLRQPRVLPPPSFSFMNKKSFKAAPEHPSSSAYLESETDFQVEGKSDEEILQQTFENGSNKLDQHLSISSPQTSGVLVEQHEERNNSRCGSQSSVSVSSPPSSPTHLSHDILDDTGDLPSLPSSADGKPLALSDDECAMKVPEAVSANIMMSSRSFPCREEDEWTIENTEEMQEQEDYDEEDDYHEEAEVVEGDNENLNMSMDFSLHSDVQNATADIDSDQKVLGFNDGAEVRIPSSDEFEGPSENVEKDIEAHIISNDAIQRRSSFDGIVYDDQRLHGTTSFSAGTEDTSNIINVAEKVIQNLVLEPVISTSMPVNSSLETLSDGVPAQTYGTSPFNLSMPPLPTGQPIPSSVSTVSQPEVPVKLQFGLFSGPSLIPSPVPAIQIGSIQMPLHLHPPIGPSLAHVHPSQPPFFQFGQLQYTSPLSRGILPLNHQNIPFIQSSVPTHYSFNQNIGNTVSNNLVSDFIIHNTQTEKIMPSLSIPNKPIHVEQHSNQSHNKKDLKGLGVPQDVQKNVMSAFQDKPQSTPYNENKNSADSVSEMQIQGAQDCMSKHSSRSMNNKSEQHKKLHSRSGSSQLVTGEKHLAGSRISSQVPVGRGKRYVYTVKSSGSGSPFPEPEGSWVDSTSAQRRPRRNIRRTEFRVRENERKRNDASDLSNYLGQDEKPHSNESLEVSCFRSGYPNETLLNKSSKSTIEAESSVMSGMGLKSITDGNHGRKSGKESAPKVPTSMVLHSNLRDANVERNGSIEEDVDAPLQSGVVRVFRQTGIEAPSDEDDFIEVRSKRQMLNDRREQREKESKARPRVMKAPRKSRSLYHSIVVTDPNKTVSGDASKNAPTPFVTERTGYNSSGPSAVFSANIVSQPLAPIGTPAVNPVGDTRLVNKKSAQTSSSAVVSIDGGMELVPELIFESNAIFDNVSSSLGSWSDAHVNQQVMTLTQTQLDEAMKPERFDTCEVSVNDHTSLVLEQEKPSTSILTQDKAFPTSSILTQDKAFPASLSPLSSLLAGERIQFGAVTAPSFLPPVNRSLPNGIGPPGSTLCKSDASNEHLLAPKNDHTIFFKKEQHPSESCARLEDSEAEAEAAASAVAVAAISSDEVVSNGLSICSVSVPDHKKFAGANVSGLTSQGVKGNGEASSLSAAEEPLTVTLPADLSIETPISLWPVLPTPQSSSSPAFSHIPGAPPSHFPCFEMNPMLRGPIYAFGAHDESLGTQSQPQRSTTLSSGPLGAWPPQCHSGVDSFYGPPAGFAGPFISPPAGMPGVQTPPHMVFYNHFPPLAPFGVSIMGTTFISSGKPPDWKHNPVSSTMVVSEGDVNNASVCSAQHNPPSMPAPIQHLAPGSPLMPMASPLPMFDMTPFQPSVDIPLQARWSHMPLPPLHGVPLSPLPCRQVDGGMPSEVGHSLNLPVDSSSGNTRFTEPQSSAAADVKFSFPADPGAQFPELGLVDMPSSSEACASSSGPIYSSASGNSMNHKGPNGANDLSRRIVANSGEAVSTVTASTNSSSQSTLSPTKPRTAAQPTPSQKYLHPIGYSDRRGTSSSQKVSGGEWHGRGVFQGRNQSTGNEKNYSASKMKQIYVAKSQSSRAATPG